MAIFSEHIKGLSSGGIYTNIDFLDNDTPNISVGGDKGNIVTTNRLNTFKQPTIFSKPTTFNNTLEVKNGESDIFKVTLNDGVTVSSKATFTNILTVGGAATFNNTLAIKNENTDLLKVTAGEGLKVTSAATFTNGLTVVKGALKVNEGESTFENGVNAAWFNATSDERAKDEIHRLDNQFIVLREIANWNFYSFNYKSSPQERQIGIIAQEHLDTKERLGFEVVSNPEATGENGDYMCVKEGKIVYLALQAIQALNSLRKADEDQIKSLQKENANLRGRVQDLQKQISLIAEKLKRDFNN